MIKKPLGTISIVLLFILLVLNSGSSAIAVQKWDKQVIQDAMKVWTITFSQKVHEKIGRSGSIYITDNNGYKIATEIKRAGNEIKIIPQKAYKENVIYTLTIKKSARSEKNESLKEEIHMPFELNGSSSNKDSKKTNNKSNKEAKNKKSPLKINIVVKEYISFLTVTGDTNIARVEVDGRKMNYVGDGKFEIGIAGAEQGDTLQINAFDTKGSTVARENYLVE